MDKFLHANWWKYLGIGLLLYVVVAGFYIPLKPGIVSVDPIRATSGSSIDLSIMGYNTDWDRENKNIQCFLRYDQNHILLAEDLTFLNRKKATAQFDLPNDLPGGKQFATLSVILADEDHGYLLLPSALTIHATQDSMVSSEAEWSDVTPAVETKWVFRYPFIGLLHETTRNTFFHVAVWFAMFIMLITAFIYSIKYLRSKDLRSDALAASFTHVAILFGLIGMVTGSIWAKNTWGAYWTDDPKLNMAAVSVMIYVAYSILRNVIAADDQRARVSAAYNIFAFVAMIPLIFILPRMTQSLHPGNGGNPALGGQDLDSTLRLVFYPSIIALTIFGFWISSLLYRIRKIELNRIENQLNLT